MEIGMEWLFRSMRWASVLLHSYPELCKAYDPVAETQHCHAYLRATDFVVSFVVNTPGVAVSKPHCYCL